MKSLILSASSRFAAPVLLVFSVFLFLRGHNEPGGGFIGGLVAAAALGLCVLSDGVERVRSVLRVPPRSLLAAGLLTALAAAVWGPFVGEPVLKGLWFAAQTPLGEVKLGTPLLFDLGVFFVVLGAAMTFLFTLAEEDAEEAEVEAR